MVYLAVLGKARDIPPDAQPERVRSVARTFHYRILLALAAPLYVLTLIGRVNSVGINTNDSVASGLVSQFLVLMVALAGYSYITLRGRSKAFGVVVAVVVAMVTLGERGAIAGAVIPLLWACARIGLKPSKQQIALVAAAMLMAALAISGSHITSGGREGFGYGKGPASRISTTLSGVTAVFTGRVTASFVGDYFQRIDGNDSRPWPRTGSTRASARSAFPLSGTTSGWRCRPSSTGRNFRQT